MMKKQNPTLEQIISLAKRRGFVYPSSEIYGGLANCYDYGPLGTELLRNIRNLWWKEFVTNRQDMLGLDSQIMLHPQTWVASGHVSSFTDPLVEDKVTHKRYRADHLIAAWVKTQDDQKLQNMVIEDLSTQDMAELIQKYKIKSPDGNEVTEPKDFRLLFETAIGSVAGEKSKVYLRGETAQGIFTNFKQVLDSNRAKLPFGIGQIGKSFRNEITTGQFVFRTLEFEQAEIEYFFDPDKEKWQDLFKQWQEDMWQFVNQTLGVNEKKLRWRRHTDKERSHYSKDTYDLDYQYPFGWSELWGLAYRTDYDLKQHIKYSKQTLKYTDPYTQKKFVPHVIEPAVGINRIFLMVLSDAYLEDKKNKRTLLKLKPSLAPYKLAVFPLLRNKKKLVAKAQAVFDSLKEKYHSTWDDRGNIGKRYLYQDEMGTPYCITIDFQTLEDDSITIRNRDTTKQERINLDKVESYFQTMLN
ncbi:MAG: glycine--tRNA ligase [Candidatus Woesebacteria bacterium]